MYCLFTSERIIAPQAVAQLPTAELVFTPRSVEQWTVEKSEQPLAITRYELEKLMPNNGN